MFFSGGNRLGISRFVSAGGSFFPFDLVGRFRSQEKNVEVVGKCLVDVINLLPCVDALDCTKL